MKREEALARRAQSRAELARVGELIATAGDAEALRSAADELEVLAATDAGFWEAHWHLASVLDSLGDLEGARDHYAEAVCIAPDAGGNSAHAAMVYGRLADCFEITGQAREAIRYYCRFLREFPTAPEASAVAARLALLAECAAPWLEAYQSAAHEQQAERHDAAVWQFDEAARLFPEGACVYFLRGLSERGLGRSDEAIRSLEKASELDNDSRVNLEMGVTYGDIGNPYVEEGFYTRALDLSRRDALALYSMGAAFYGRRDRDQALEYLEMAVDLAPEAPWADKACDFIDDILRTGVLALPGCLREPVSWMSWLHEMEGISLRIPAGAVALEDKATEDLLALVDTPDQRLFYFRLRSLATPEDFELEQYVRLNDASLRRDASLKIETRERMEVCSLPVYFTEVRETATDYMVMNAALFRGDQILEFWCRAPWVIYRRARNVFVSMFRDARVLSVRDLHRARSTLFARVLQHDPRDHNALAGYGAALIGMGDFQAAQDVYNQMLALDPDNAIAHGDLGMCYWQQNKIDLAIQALTRATARNPDRRLLKTLGLAYEKKRQPDRALKVYQRALELGTDLSIEMLVGVAYESMRKYDQAEREYKKVLAQNPTNLRVRLLLGALYRRQKRLTDATACYREAVDLDAQSVDANLMLGICFIESHYWDMAEKALNKVILLDYNNQAARDALETLAVERKKSRRY